MATQQTERKHYLPEGLAAPAPGLDGLEAEFWEAARRHELVVQRCSDCQTFQWGPEWICHRCHSFDLGWQRVAGRGHIYSWERVWYPAHPALQTAVPYLGRARRAARRGQRAHGGQPAR